MREHVKEYECEIVLCAGRACGSIAIEAITPVEAEEKVFAYVSEKLAQALPELEIELEVGKAKKVEGSEDVCLRRSQC